MGTGKHRWKISFHRSSSRPSKKPPPQEFVCPISGTVMADPVIVTTGQTFERNCIQACKELGYTPRLSDGSRPDVSSLIPNFAIKSTILSWCDATGFQRPTPLDFARAKDLVRGLIASSSQEMLDVSRLSSPRSGSAADTTAAAAEEKRGTRDSFAEIQVIGDSELSGNRVRKEIEAMETADKQLLEGVSENPPVKFRFANTVVDRLPKFYSFSSEESVLTTPLPLATKPSCYSSSSSSSSSSPELIPASAEEDEIFAKLASSLVTEQEEGVIALRRMTKNSPEERIPLCSNRVLAALRALLVSKYTGVQVNAVAAVVNLSLEKSNKVQMVRCGLVPPVVDVLKGGSEEAQEHAAGAIFSLALEDENKTAIGVLGALPPLLHLLMRSERERTREDAALALYHLSLAQANRSKLLRVGAVGSLLGMAQAGELATRALIILGSLAASAEGRSALLDAHGVERLVGMMSEAGSGGRRSEGVRDNCVAVLYALSQSGMRFKGSAIAAGAAEVLRGVADRGNDQRARAKAKRMLLLLKERSEEEEEEECGGVADDEEEEEERGGGEAAASSSTAGFRRRIGTGKKVSGFNSTEF